MPINLDDLFKKKLRVDEPPLKPHSANKDREVGYLYDQAVLYWERNQALIHYGKWALENLSGFQKRSENYKEACKWFGVEEE